MTGYGMTASIRTALVSVSDKTGIVDFCRFLEKQGVAILSTGGTSALLKKEGVAVTDVADYTGFPEMMDGRVKTLHPKVHGGILGKRSDTAHMDAASTHDIQMIDLVVINLYPFEATVARGAGDDEVIENIDIGGPSMVRSAAKNHEDVTIIVDPADYATVQEEMVNGSGATSLETRRMLAGKAYARTAAYDAAISQWFASKADGMPVQFAVSAALKQSLRYGENPHQNAAFYQVGSGEGTLAGARQIQGKELSYNNINDTDAALALVREFEQPTVAIIKHANPCGVASAESMLQAYENAFSCDPQSAFGGIIALNRALDAKTAEAISKQFAEVIIAPDATPDALELMAGKKNLRILLTGDATPNAMPYTITTVSGGLLVQQPDAAVLDESALTVVTKRQPSEAEMADLRFAFAVGKHVKSNAIVMARGGMTVGIGAGQMSRVDSVRIASWKAGEAKLGTKGAVLASDAFFPFDDNIHSAAEAGITAIIQPGGSIRDDEVIAAADKYDMAMVFTGMRHFRH